MRKYTINRRTVKEVVNNNNAAKVSHFIHVLPKTQNRQKKITKCKYTTVPIKFNKLISEIQVLCWPINQSFYGNTKTLVKWNKMFRRTVAERGFYSISWAEYSTRRGS